MKQTRRIEIAFEIARDLVFGSNWRNCAAWCSGCESYVPMITIFTAATLDKTTYAEIFRRAETGELHHKVSNDGALLICFSSLLNMDEETDGKDSPSDSSEVQTTQPDYLIR